MTRYAVTVFTRDGRTDTRLNMGTVEARRVADTHRPVCGASYIHDETRRLVFKPYRMSSPELRRPCPMIRRASAAQVEAAAKRFDADGEHENAVQMRALA